MTKSTARRIGRHGAALFGSTCILGAVPILIYVGLVIASGDLGGPLNVIIVPLLSAAFGGTVSVFLFLPLGLLAERFNFRRWMWVIGILTGVFATTAVLGCLVAVVTGGSGGAAGSLAMLASQGLVLVGGFFVYLCVLWFFMRVFP